MERPFSSKVIDAVYSGYSGDSFDVPGCDHYVYGLTTEVEARRLASHHDAQHRRNQR